MIVSQPRSPRKVEGSLLTVVALCAMRGMNQLPTYSLDAPLQEQFGMVLPW